ncbi:arylsulfatase [Pollutibacter soli]|uniref:arylsulfatase n=1 Tax=Pollutibacter soli TaxID=3034157 RepID=UPI0030138412
MKKGLFLLLVTSQYLLSCGTDAAKNNEVTTSTDTATVKPNILFILADDMGFTDISPFGGNISTPVIESVSKESMLFSNYHVQPTCSPTRSSLLTGNDNHVAGLGIMSEMDYPALNNLHLPGYSGHLSNQVVTLPELLRGTGYHTYMTGKWHLGEGAGLDPHDRGFEESFILGTGGGSHFNDRKALSPLQHMSYTHNGKEIEPPADFYSSRNYTDSMISFIDKNKDDKKPFFGYLSYTAVHDPLQAPEEYIKKYKGKFDMGWDSLRVLRTNNLKALGIVPENMKMLSISAIPKWNTLPKEKQKEFARDMEVYAAMLDYMDMSIGRVIEYLKKQGMYDNTLILFMSDNGANGAVASTYPGNENGKYLGSFDNAFENRGLKNSYVEMGPGWAQAVTGPFNLFKTFASEGGIRAPLIIKMPKESTVNGKWNRSFVHVTDIMPTILEITGTAYPTEFRGNQIHPMIGKSILPVLTGKADAAYKDEGRGYELFEMKAYIKGKWKILRQPIPFSTGKWQLFDLENDPGETTDLSANEPAICRELIKGWENYVIQNNVYDHHGHYDSVYKASYTPPSKKTKK